MGAVRASGSVPEQAKTGMGVFVHTMFLKFSMFVFLVGRVNSKASRLVRNAGSIFDAAPSAFNCRARTLGYTQTSNFYCFFERARQNDLNRLNVIAE